MAVDLENYTCARVPGVCVGGTRQARWLKWSLARVVAFVRREEEVMGWIKRIAQTRNFLAVRKSWFGAGGEPVSPELAQARANVCLKCPMNYKGDWLWNMATQMAINAQSQLRSIMKLKVEGEEDLKTCEACGCVTRLKIYVRSLIFTAILPLNN